MKILLVLFIFLLLILFPIRIKVRIIYENNKLNIYIYNKLLNFSSAKSETTKTVKYNTKTKTKTTIPKGRAILGSLFDEYFKKNPFDGNFTRKLKPSVKIDCKIIYGFEDAALTAISYGVFCSIPSQLRNIIEQRLKLKSYVVNIEPKFNSEILKFRILSIFSLNLVQIIYILKVIKAYERK